MKIVEWEAKEGIEMKRTIALLLAILALTLPLYSADGTLSTADGTLVEQGMDTECSVPLAEDPLAGAVYMLDFDDILSLYLDFEIEDLGIEIEDEYYETYLSYIKDWAIIEEFNVQSAEELELAYGQLDFGIEFLEGGKLKATMAGESIIAQYTITRNRGVFISGYGLLGTLGKDNSYILIVLDDYLLDHIILHRV